MPAASAAARARARPAAPPPAAGAPPPAAGAPRRAPDGGPPAGAATRAPARRAGGRRAAAEKGARGRRAWMAGAVALPAVLRGAPWDARAEPLLPPLLPREYKEKTGELVDTLKNTIDLEASGASEFEVRKSGGPAKELVKEFLSSRWESDDAIRGDASYTETSAAIRELGAFYQKNGQRAKLPPAVAASVGGHLDRARAALDGAGVRKEGLAALLDRGAPADGRG